MPWGPPIPLDDPGTTATLSDRKVEIRHRPSPTRIAAGAILVALGPLVVGVPVLLGWDVNLLATMLAAGALMLVGLVLAVVRAQIVVTEASLFRWGGMGRPRPEVVETEQPVVEVWQEPRDRGTVHVVQIHDRGEVLDVAESVDPARARRVAEALAEVLGVEPPT